MEVVIVVGILGLISSFGIGGYLHAHQRATLDSQTDVFVAAIQTAQANAQSSVLGRGWGVRCAGQTWERFSITATATVTEVQQSFRSPVQCNGGPEVRFAKLTGTATGSPSIILKDSTTSKKITISNRGVISVQ